MPESIEGTVNSRYQRTIPAKLRVGLGVKPGDKVRYDVRGGKPTIEVVRPDVRTVLEELWASHDMTPLHDETGGDAAALVREQRGWDKSDDEH